MFGCSLLEGCFLLKVKEGVVDLEEKGGCGDGGAEAGEALVGMYCMREESMFK